MRTKGRRVTQRRRASAARRLAELPPDDGLIPIRIWMFGTLRWTLITPDEIHEHFAAQMAEHDSRRKKLRWGGNQWGEEWVQKPERREAFNRRMPLLKTDLPYPAWKRAIR